MNIVVQGLPSAGTRLSMMEILRKDSLQRSLSSEPLPLSVLKSFECFDLYTHRDDKVLAVASLNFDPVVSRSAELMCQDKMPSGTQLRLAEQKMCF